MHEFFNLLIMNVSSSLSLLYFYVTNLHLKKCTKGFFSLCCDDSPLIFNAVLLSSYAKSSSSYLRVNGIVIKSSTLTLNPLPLKYENDFFPTRLKRFYLEVV